MSTRAIQDQLATVREVSVADTAGRKVAIYPTDNSFDYRLQPKADEFSEFTGTSPHTVLRGDAEDLIRVLRHLGVTTKLQAARIAFRAKGNIVFLNLADISAVEAQGNYISLRHRTHSYLVHESLSSMTDKLKPYGFIRIHRSVVVNTSAVEEIKPLPTGEYRLRVKGGNEYQVTRTYKHNLRNLAQLWVGTGGPHEQSG